ncbi:probable E3 ubiquitin-protein ligase RHY1A [Olea europaea var. sylvestris]|uniref:probable E3 ubiquitin-protein ligase RHY1A n=1 Tax=Olea europaea var. sylvestris TaxID=158386 RepID=UPI000C1D5782|nr:probable E3 ubiquitin-protein ligase RHY1A [Olea europaea var. sylvestris]
MTSASELFNTRRSRFGRSSNPLDLEPEFNSPTPLDRNNRRHHRHSNNHHHHNSGGRDRLDIEGCNPLRRLPRQSRHAPSNRPPLPLQERDSIWLDRGIHHSASGIVSSGNSRLPGSVLLARERLLRRLRGVTLSGDRLVDAGDWETETSEDWQASIPLSTDSVTQQIGKRPPGLTQEALNSLHVDIFNDSDESDKQAISRASRECSICLESFLMGDELICLPCAHRFHFRCLEPWLRTCGDCPYCRRDIVVTTDEVKSPEFLGV